MSAVLPAEQNEDPIVGRVVQGRFKVLRRLAAGGMGVVYEAEQQPLGRKVALKILELSKLPHDSSFKERFFLEANAAAKLAHPNTIVVHDYGSTEDGLYFIAMEYLDGGTLGERMKETGPLPPDEAIHVGMQIASSLRCAHEQGLVHRDMKPGNVMFAPRGGDPNFVKVLDFGLVKVLDEGKENLQLTQSGVMMGSPRYMAPEQVKAQPCDARTDIYSFGAVMYHLLTGAPPFHAGSVFEAMQHHLYTPAPPMRTTWPSCPVGPALEALVLRCLEKEPAHRPQSMDAVMDGLRAAANEVGGGLSGVGSYLGAGASSTGSDPGSLSGRVPPPAQPVVGAASGSQITSSGIVDCSQVQPTRASSKTVRFDSAPPAVFRASAPPPAAAASTDHRPAAKRGGAGALKVVLGLAALVLSAGVAIALTVVVLGTGATPDASAQPVAASADPPPAPSAPSPEPSPPEPSPPAPSAPSPDPSPAPPVVSAPLLRLITDPAGATVRRDGSDLGDAPLDLRIPTGARWTLIISLEGYVSRTVVVQGGQPSLTLHLEAAPTAERPRGQRPRRPPVPLPTVRRLGPATPTPSNPRPNPGTYAPDLDDPWAH